MKIGIIGGTFNPIHFAHLRIAEEVREMFALDRVLFIPTASPPHKPLAGELAFRHRLQMVELALLDNPAFMASDMEGIRGGKSYSIDTLRALRQERPADEFYFIIGSDSFREICLWREYQAIFSLTNIVAMERPGTAVADPLAALPIAITGEFCYYAPEKRLAHRSGYSVYYREGVPLDISSSAIRDLVHLGRSIRYLVPSGVANYIKEHRLYANAQ
jgi:nicotinate-nucleotide adenylyltransferase